MSPFLIVIIVVLIFFISYKKEKVEEIMVFINPSIYLKCYLDAFKNSIILDYVDKLKVEEQEKIKQRILNKYLNK